MILALLLLLGLASASPGESPSLDSVPERRAPVDLGSAALVPDQVRVRASSALAPAPTVLGFGTLTLGAPLVRAAQGRLTLGLTGQGGFVVSHAPGEGRTGVRARASGAGLWLALHTPESGQRHALGLVVSRGTSRWFLWHPDEAETAFHLAWDSWMPLTSRVSLRGSTWVGATRVWSQVAHFRGDALVVFHPAPALSVGTGVVFGIPEHLQAVVSLTHQAAPGLEVGGDVQLPLRAPSGWGLPIPTLGLRLTVSQP